MDEKEEYNLRVRKRDPEEIRMEAEYVGKEEKD